MTINSDQFWGGSSPSGCESFSLGREECVEQGLRAADTDAVVPQE